MSQELHPCAAVCVCVCLQAVYASVLPGELMRGYMGQFPTFPSWLGKYSSTNKHSRIVQELASHMSLKWVELIYSFIYRWSQSQCVSDVFVLCRTLSSRQAVNLDYLHYMRKALLNPLQRFGAEGAGQAVQMLDDYQLVREDVDSIMEISIWGGQPDPYSKLDSKVSGSALVWSAGMCCCHMSLRPFYFVSSFVEQKSLAFVGISLSNYIIITK